MRIVEALNARLKLVARLKRVKEERRSRLPRPGPRGVDAPAPRKREPRPAVGRGPARDLHGAARPDEARGPALGRPSDYSSGSAANSSGETASRKRRNSAGSRSASGGTPAAAAISSSVRLALELDAGLLDHVVRDVDLRAGADGQRDRVGGARVDLDLRAVLPERDLRVEGVLAQLGDRDRDHLGVEVARARRSAGRASSAAAARRSGA